MLNGIMYINDRVLFQNSIINQPFNILMSTLLIVIQRLIVISICQYRIILRILVAVV